MDRAIALTRVSKAMGVSAWMEFRTSELMWFAWTSVAANRVLGLSPEAVGIQAAIAEAT